MEVGKGGTFSSVLLPIFWICWICQSSFLQGGHCPSPPEVSICCVVFVRASIEGVRVQNTYRFFEFAQHLPDMIKFHDSRNNRIQKENAILAQDTQ